MLKKIFKTIIIFSFILSTIIPTNAAVSVSDGSAFVTKAEFSADLNNLSNRMASLENSLDAKIDSLVSSYLTRNGIWNGAKQTLISNSFKYGMKSGGTRDAGRVYFNIFNAIIEQTVAKMYTIQVSGASGRYQLIDKIDKSGMIFFNTYSGASGNGNMTAVPVSATGSSNVINLANVRFIYECIFSYKTQSEGSTTFDTKNVATCQLLGFGVGCSLQVPALPVGTVSFFVSKNDKVVLDAEQTTTTYTTTGNDPCTLAFYAANQETYKTYVIRDCYVY